MAQDTLLGFPAHTLPYRCGEFTTLSTVSVPALISRDIFPACAEQMRREERRKSACRGKCPHSRVIPAAPKLFSKKL